MLRSLHLSLIDLQWMILLAILRHSYLARHEEQWHHARVAKLYYKRVQQTFLQAGFLELRALEVALELPIETVLLVLEFELDLDSLLFLVSRHMQLDLHLCKSFRWMLHPMEH